jgi:hypothetical protein
VVVECKKSSGSPEHPLSRIVASCIYFKMVRSST